MPASASGSRSPAVPPSSSRPGRAPGTTRCAGLHLDRDGRPKAPKSSRSEAAQAIRKCDRGVEDKHPSDAWRVAVSIAGYPRGGFKALCCSCLRFARASFRRFLSFRQRRLDSEPRPIWPDRSSVHSSEPLAFVKQCRCGTRRRVSAPDTQTSTDRSLSAAARWCAPAAPDEGSSDIFPRRRAGVSSVRERFPLPATAEARSEGEGGKNAQAHDPRVGPHTTVSFEECHRRTG